MFATARQVRARAVAGISLNPTARRARDRHMVTSTAIQLSFPS